METWRTAAEHVEYGHRSRRDITLYDGYGQGEKHACDIERNVALADYGDKFSLVER